METIEVTFKLSKVALRKYVANDCKESTDKAAALIKAKNDIDLMAFSSNPHLYEDVEEYIAKALVEAVKLKHGIE